LEPKEDNKTTASSSPKKKTLIRAAPGQRTEREDFHFRDRWQQVVVKRLRTGHTRLNAHMFKKMKPAPLPTCNLQLEDQTAEHTLQSCPLLQTTRQTVWPAAVQLHIHTKLYSSREKLEKTATFILQTGLSV